MKCPSCQLNQAEKSNYGYVNCKECQIRQRKLKKADRQLEWTSDSVREQRRAHHEDIIQPFRNGELSKEYVSQYGTKSIKVDKREVKKAKNVWNDKYYKEP